MARNAAGMKASTRTTMTKIIGLDISKNSTGVAIGDGTGPPRVLRARFQGSTHGQIGEAFMRWLRELCVVESPGMICAEAAFVGRTDNLYESKLMLGLDFTAQTVASMRRIEYQAVAVQTWRKAFLGHGRPENPKRAAILMCKTIGWDVDGSHDKADACGVWAWGHLYHGNTKGIHKMLSTGSVRMLK